MPANRPRASFEPLPPDLDIASLVENTPNFQFVDRISFDKILEHGQEKFSQLVLLHVIMKGKPLVIDGFSKFLDGDIFSIDWLSDTVGDKVENARDLSTQTNIPLTVKHYLKHMTALTDQFFENDVNYRDKTRQRVYLKDIDCPTLWEQKVRDLTPPGLMYLNESSGLPGGPGSVPEPSPDGTSMRPGPGIAPAGDLMSSLPPEMRAENLMCYIGHEGTYTPAHREMCASLGQNIMVAASTDSQDEDGMPLKPGSSIWFMTETSDRHLVAEYWLSVLGHDIEVEGHFAQLAAWKNAPFKTYIVEQKAGDFILVPPLAPHQVWNRGSYTVKVAWNRTTVETLERAFSEALPNSRMVCRDEQYKNKAIVYFSLKKYSRLMELMHQQIVKGTPESIEMLRRSPKIRQLRKDFVTLFDMFRDMMLSEAFSMDNQLDTPEPEFLPFDSNVTCSYCRGNIFNRFLTCKGCKDIGTGVDEPYDICMECYIMGRTCRCQTEYAWVEQFKWEDLLKDYEEWLPLALANRSAKRGKDMPLPFIQEMTNYKKRGLAELCQSRMYVRAKEIEGGYTEDEIRKALKGSSRFEYGLPVCHVCRNPHFEWMCVQCSCQKWWCFGTLWRAYDLMPQTVLEDTNWKCPHCQNICNAGVCRRMNKNLVPYEPKGTLLGHDTKLVADPRSFESLVNFSKPNTNWTRIFDEDGGQNARIERRLREAENHRAMEPMLDDDLDDLPPIAGMTHMPEATKNIAYDEEDDMTGAAPTSENPANPVPRMRLMSKEDKETYFDRLGSLNLEGEELRGYLERARSEGRLLHALSQTKGLSLIAALRLPAAELERIEQFLDSREMLPVARQALLSSNVQTDESRPARRARNPPKRKPKKKKPRKSVGKKDKSIPGVFDDDDFDDDEQALTEDQLDDFDFGGFEIPIEETAEKENTPSAKPRGRPKGSGKPKMTKKRTSRNSTGMIKEDPERGKDEDRRQTISVDHLQTADGDASELDWERFESFNTAGYQTGVDGEAHNSLPNGDGLIGSMSAGLDMSAGHGNGLVGGDLHPGQAVPDMEADLNEIEMLKSLAEYNNIHDAHVGAILQQQSGHESQNENLLQHHQVGLQEMDGYHIPQAYQETDNNFENQEPQQSHVSPQLADERPQNVRVPLNDMSIAAITNPVVTPPTSVPETDFNNGSQKRPDFARGSIFDRKRGKRIRISSGVKRASSAMGMSPPSSNHPQSPTKKMRNVD